MTDNGIAMAFNAHDLNCDFSTMKQPMNSSLPLNLSYRVKAGQRCRFARWGLLRTKCVSKERHLFKVLYKRRHTNGSISNVI